MILKVITFNIWFSSYKFKARMEALTNLLELHQPDLICLQEVIPNSLGYLTRRFPDYYCSHQSLGHRDYGEIIMSQYPLASVSKFPFKSEMERQLLKAEITVDGVPITVATTHLESLKDSAYTRLYQFHSAMEILDRDDDVIYCGDFNLLGKEEEMIQLPEGWWDVWEQIDYSEKWQYTYDHTQNVYIQNPYQNRLDRIYYKSTTEKIVPISFKLLGKGRSNHISPSDHFGILTQFDVMG